MRKILFIIGFVTLVVSGCELWTAQKDPDFWKKLDEEIAWANVEKLTVSVVYPLEWGSSPQSGTGRVFDAVRTNENPRVGYPFNVQFNSNPIYGNAQWRAYKTSDLPESSDWYINTIAINNELKEGKPLSLEQVSFSSSSGDITTVVVYISDDITLIPWSRLQPRIVMSDPPLNSTHLNKRSPNRDIIITFAAPVDSETLKFEDGFIEITGKIAEEDILFPEVTNGNMKDYFYKPHYDEENYTLTIQSKGDIPVGLILEVKLGEGIRSPGSDLGMEQVTFSYQTSESTLSITKWEAKYNKDENRIEVSWTLPNAQPDDPPDDPLENITPLVRYRINNGSFLPIILKDSDSLVIESIPTADASDVRKGDAVSGINRYMITFDLGDDITIIDIYNVPGMVLNQVNTVLLTQENIDNELKAKNSAGINFLLTQDVILENWIPVGNDGKPFKGNFYGNGHTIKIESFVDENTLPADIELSDWGLFGVVSGGFIRDLTVEYVNIDITSTKNREFDIAVGGTSPSISGTQFGGITGMAVKAAEFINVLVKGNAVFTVEQDTIANVGGITGYMFHTEKIYNAYSDIEITINKTGTSNSYYNSAGAEPTFHFNNTCFGGIVGCISGDATTYTEHFAIEAVTVTGNLKHYQAAGSILTGGVIGYIRSVVKLSDLEFSSSLEVSKKSSDIYDYGTGHIGGIVGYARAPNRTKNILFINLRVSGKIEIPNYDSHRRNVDLGGLIGYTRWVTIKNSWCVADITSKNIKINDTTQGNLNCGGIIGLAGEIKAENCWYGRGKITSDGMGNLNLGGGFGSIRTLMGETLSSLINCRSMASRIEGIRSMGNINIGGFAGLTGGYFRECYSKSDIVYVEGAANVYAGGFIGNWIIEFVSGNFEINQCYATGNVTAKGTGSSTNIVTAGGLVGNMNAAITRYYSIQNSYALGNVKAEGGASKTYAGGLVGFLDEQVDSQNRPVEYQIQHNFAHGMVEANGTGTVYAGGIVGYMNITYFYKQGTIQNNAALNNDASNTMVKATGGVEPNTAAGRIFGGIAAPAIPVTPPTITTTNNYARTGMTRSPGTVTNSHSGKDGETTDHEIFATSTFWISNKMNFNDATTPNIKNIWNFAGIEGRGYPLLVGLGDQK